MSYFPQHVALLRLPYRVNARAPSSHGNIHWKSVWRVEAAVRGAQLTLNKGKAPEKALAANRFGPSAVPPPDRLLILFGR